MRNPTKHSVLVVIRGIPGSGKSHIAAELKKSIGRGRVVVLDPDATDYSSEAYIAHKKKLAKEGVDPKLYAYRFLRAQAYEGISDNKIIIWDQPFTNLEIFNKMVGRLRAHAENCGVPLPILVVEVEIDKSIAKQRITQRKSQGGHGPSDNTLNRRIDDYKSFSDSYKTIKINGNDDVSRPVSLIGQTVDDLTKSE